jgi:CMP-N-acetylneuraminic acid synthetase
LTNVEDINRAIELYFKKKAKSLISIVKNNKPIEWFLEKKINNKITPYINKNFRSNRQQTKQLYIPNGAIYIFNSANLIKNNSYFNNLTYSYVMPKSRSIDIDDKIDFQIAEYLFKKKFR